MPIKQKKRNKKTISRSAKSKGYNLPHVWKNTWPSLQAFILTALPILATFLIMSLFIVSGLAAYGISLLILVYLPFSPVVYYVAYLFFLQKHNTQSFFMARIAAAMLVCSVYIFVAGSLLFSSVFCGTTDCGGSSWSLSSPRPLFLFTSRLC